MKEEVAHFNECREAIRENIKAYEQKVQAGKQETEDLFAAVASGDVELYNQLIVSKDMLFHNENALRKNRAALEKPYFGRVDYRECDSGQEEKIYIGKNGVTRNRTEVLVVDWRAPVSTIYYENELGDGSYFVPEVGEIKVELNLKRTFDVSDGKLLGYYDNDAVATDELLVKYLSQNKDVVLGDIISTIQKEQNEIIRESPYYDVIVQGVAGSGKTTVAMHRISYILYNYEKKFVPSEFCIIGGNDMLLHYITSGLPELDVHDVGQKRMDLFFRDLLEKEHKKEFGRLFGKKPGKEKVVVPVPAEDACKSKMEFILALEQALAERKASLIPLEDIRDEKLGVILSKESIADTLRENPDFSVFQLQKLLNERLQKRIAFLMTEEENAEKKKAVKAQYKGYFKMDKSEMDILKIYEEFLTEYLSGKMDLEQYPADGASGRRTTSARKLSAEEKKECKTVLPETGKYHVYDLAALTLIWKRITAKKPTDEYGQIIIDEAQDFGTAVYYVLKQVLTGCYFTIMGDVSQNINYETGMNGWEEVREQVFAGERTSFHILAKSYRNTIEISEYAGKILEKASFGAYKITPVIRHGRQVEFHRVKGMLPEKIKSLTAEIADRGYDTTAVICRSETEAEMVRSWLGQEEEGEDFEKGVMVLPIQLTKGLEFDAVILMNPSPEAYRETEADAKLLYVAVTRALHELHVVYEGELSKLFD